MSANSGNLKKPPLSVPSLITYLFVNGFDQLFYIILVFLPDFEFRKKSVLYEFSLCISVDNLFDYNWGYGLNFVAVTYGDCGEEDSGELGNVMLIIF